MIVLSVSVLERVLKRVGGMNMTFNDALVILAVWIGIALVSYVQGKK
jgi:hypothetical protein